MTAAGRLGDWRVVRLLGRVLLKRARELGNPRLADDAEQLIERPRISPDPAGYRRVAELLRLIAMRLETEASIAEAEAAEDHHE